jgi:cbb3-type cytochrome oxidase subunit 3
MTPEIAYFVFGITLCVCLVGVWIFLYSKKRHDTVERAKYKMLDDDDDG